MLTPQTMNAGFDLDLKSILPRLRVYAMSLTRDIDRADDLVQQTALKALAGRESFQPGTNFAGWMFRIERNEFISELRRARPTISIDDPVAQAKSHPPLQENGLIMRDFMAAFRQLPDGGRQALLLAAVEGQPYDQIAKRTGITEGAVKSRIRRGREMLKRLLDPQVTADRDTRPRHTSRRTTPCLPS
jgi:RNA polymerase sigma-70 factor (ECF subfamily)